MSSNPLKRLGPLRRFIQVPFLQRLGERIEEAPDVPLLAYEKGTWPKVEYLR